MKPSQAFIVALVGIGCFLAGRSIPSHSDATEGAVAGAPEPERQPLRIQLRKMRTPDSRSWSEVFELAASAQESDDWIALLEETRLDQFLTEAIVRRWAEQDPGACWEHLLTLGDGVLPPGRLAEVAARAWGGQNPEAAIAALGEVTSEKYDHISLRGKLGWIVVRAGLANDLERGMALMPLPFAGGSFGWGSLEPWMEADPEKACRAIAALPQGSNFRRTVGPAAREWYRRDPEAAMAWCRQLPNDLKNDAFSKITDDLLAANDFDGARDLALSIESMFLRQSVSSSYISHLRRTDPDAACGWAIENFDGRMLGGVIGNIVGNVDFKVHPPSTFLPYFDQMPEGSGKGQSARRLIRRWVGTDGLAATAAVEWGETLDPRTRSEALSSSTVSDWAKNPESREWLTTAPDSSFSQRVLGQIVSDMNDPDKARAWAITLPPVRAAQVAAALELAK